MIFALPKYKSLRFKENWRIYVISSLFNIILYYGLQTVGLNYMPAGLFSAIVFLQPVLLGLFSDDVWPKDYRFNLRFYWCVYIECN